MPLFQFVRIIRSALFLSILFLAVPYGYSAASPASDAVGGVAASGRVTLDELVEIGLKSNPGIKAKRLAWKSTIEKYPQARALEDPVLSYTEAFSEIETRLGPNKRSIMLSQKLPFPGKFRLKGEIVNKEVEIARVALDRAARDLVLDIKKAYFELYYLDKAGEFAQERIKVFEHFSRAEMNNYSVGVTRFSDVVSAETRYADAEYDLILFTELRSAAASTLNTLLNRDPEERVALVEAPAIEEDRIELKELYRLIEGHESILVADHIIERDGLKEKLSKFTSRPNFMLGLKYIEIGDPVMPGLEDGGKDAVAITLGMSIPLWSGKNRAAREEASLTKAKSERERIALSNGLNAKAKKAYVDMKSNYQLVKLYSDSLIPKAEKLIDTVQIMYTNGNGSIADLFESRVMSINFRLAYHRAASNYLINRAELERLTAGFVLKEVATDD
jgi:outer membrane protein TolC